MLSTTGLERLLHQAITSASTENQAEEAVLRLLWKADGSVSEQGVVGPVGQLAEERYYLVQDADNTHDQNILLVSQNQQFSLNDQGYLQNADGYIVLGAPATDPIYSPQELAPLPLAEAMTYSSETTYLHIFANLSAQIAATADYHVGDMQKGVVASNYSQNVQVADAQGNAHVLQFDYVKVATNTWAVEVSKKDDPTHVESATLVFENDGILNAALSTYSAPFGIDVEWGYFKQFDLPFSTSAIKQNGIPITALETVTIDEAGQVIALYADGTERTVASVPLTDVRNETLLTQVDEQHSVFSTDASNLSLEATAVNAALLNDRMFLVQDPNNPNHILVTKKGDFSLTNDGHLQNSDGFLLLGMDSKNTGYSENKLTPISLDVDDLYAAPTEHLSLGINLYAGDKVIPPKEGILEFADDSINHGHDAFMPIFPGSEPKKGIHQGDVIIFEAEGHSPHQFTYGGLSVSDSITKGILGAHVASSNFDAASTGSSFRMHVKGESFTFTYNPMSPNVVKGEFNSLSSLRDAINVHELISADITPTGELVIAPRADGSLALRFEHLSGSNFVRALDLENTSTAENRFGTLEALHTLLNNTDDIGAYLYNPLGDASLHFFAKDITDSLTVREPASLVGMHMLEEFGLTAKDGSTYIPGYQEGDMSKGEVRPFLREVTSIVDKQGVSHETNIDFLKLANNRWAVEVYEKEDPAHVTSGTLTFRGDGSLEKVSESLKHPLGIKVDWSEVTQFYWMYNVTKEEQDGIASTHMTSASLEASGNVMAHYADGSRHVAYKVPLADIRDEAKLIGYQGSDSVFETKNSNIRLELAYGKTGSNLHPDLQEYAPYTLPYSPDNPLTEQEKLQVQQQLDYALKALTGQETGDFYSQMVLAVEKAFASLDVLPPTVQGMVYMTPDMHDMAILGQGMFVVRSEASPGKIFLTRDGNFSLNAEGEWVNDYGYTLLGMDSDRKGGFALNKLEAVTENTADGYTQTATSRIALDLNLKADVTVSKVPYHPGNPEGPSMANNMVTPQFTRVMGVKDSQGETHYVFAGFLKVGVNKWAMEVYGEEGQGRPFAYGKLVFNTDGSLQAIDPLLQSPMKINWGNGAYTSNITFDLGTFGKSDGITQTAEAFRVKNIDVNGTDTGVFKSSVMDSEGVVYGSYSNGAAVPLYKVPLALVSHPEALLYAGHNTWEYNPSIAGKLNLVMPGMQQAGTLLPGALEDFSAV